MPHAPPPPPLSWTWSAFDGLDVRTLHDMLQLRAEVFVVEQACAYADVDGLDPAAHHLIGRAHGTIVATLRAFGPTAQRGEIVIGRVVVAPGFRGQGLGDVMMRQGLLRADERWPGHPVWLSAQAHLAAWYARLGFDVCGPGYDEDGIPHVPMRRPISR